MKMIFSINAKKKLSTLEPPKNANIINLQSDIKVYDNNNSIKQTNTVFMNNGMFTRINMSGKCLSCEK
jgi:hypothetical protein